MLILAVDTSSASGSIALLEDDRVLLEENVHTGLNHSRTILPAIASMMQAACSKVSDLDLFAVTTGPGSFTGLRIGVSLVKGLSLALGKPVVGVSTLDALAQNLFGSKYPICAMLDAKRGQVYAALYKIRADGRPEKAQPESVEDPRKYLETIRTEVILTGDGAAQYETIASEVLGGRYLLAPISHRSIRASAVGTLALGRFRQGATLDVLNFTPRYIRFSEAERKGLKGE